MLLVSCSPSGGAPELRLSDAWARETVEGQRSTAAYLTITNHGSADDRLVDIASPAPLRTTLHGSENSGGIVRMRPLEGGLEIPAGETAVLEPGGDHIMIENLQRPLTPGQRLTLSLRFQRSGERVVDFPVRPAVGPTDPHAARQE